MQKMFLAGWNMPGCMPDSEPADFETIEAARDYIVGELNTVIESLYTGALGDSSATPAEREAAAQEETELNEAIAYVQRQPGEFGFAVGGYHYFVTTE